MSALGTLYRSLIAVILGASPFLGPLLFLPLHSAATVYGSPIQAAGVGIACLIVSAFIVVMARSRADAEFKLKRMAFRAKGQARREKSASAAKSSFLAVMGHEIRTPLNAIMGSAELLRRTNLSMDQRENVETMLDGGQVLTDLLNDLLDLSKIEAGKLEIEDLPIETSDLIRNIERLWRPRADDKGLDFTVEIAANAPAGFMGDPTRIRQVVFNLISNAVKFTERGGVTLRIEPVETDGDDQTDETPLTLRFSVIDTGCGMDTPTLERVFLPFQQADSSTARHHGGTGLGLSICRRLSELMGGELTATSTPGEGSAFRLTLPVETVAVEDKQDDAEDDAEHAPAMTFLCVDDHPVNRRLVGALLQPGGHDVILAQSGAEAIDLYDIAEPDIVLMDISMPEMDGVEATARLRADGATAPIIALTGNVTDDDRARYLAAGMNDMVAKPIEPRALYAALSRAIASQSASATAAKSA